MLYFKEYIVQFAVLLCHALLRTQVEAKQSNQHSCFLCSSWEIIEMTFVENDKESRIITTTRKHEVAGKAGGVYKLQPLSQISSEFGVDCDGASAGCC
jgi:hypothetical protein